MKSKFRLHLIGLFFISSFSFAQESSYYVVIGTFNVEENAKRFTDYAHTLNLPALYSHHPEHNTFYVYVRTTNDKNEAYQTVESIRDEEGLKGTWVFKGTLTQQNFYVENQADLPRNKEAVAEEPEQKTEVITPDQATTNNDPTESNTPTVTEEPVNIVKEEGPKPEGKEFVFKLINSTTGNNVSGEVHLLESERSNQYHGFRSNEKVLVAPPTNKAARWYISCRVIGFKPTKKILNYKTPQGTSIGPEQEIILPIELTRVKKGDYVEMDEVKFFTNSSILMPESERELIELYNMMNENPDYKIRLHGHTNGDKSREIIKLGASQNFFALDEANEKTEGSAKEMSTVMAETVQTYLVSKGIESSRISVRGNGGKYMAFDPAGNSASRNDRVEVEVLRH